MRSKTQNKTNMKKDKTTKNKGFYENTFLLKLKTHTQTIIKKEALVIASKEKTNLVPFLQIEECEQKIKTGFFLNDSNESVFQVCSISFLEGTKTFFLKALKDINLDSEQKLSFDVVKKGFSVASVTLSDKASKGLRVDKSGELIETILSENLNVSFTTKIVIPDEENEIKKVLYQLIFNDGVDLVVTTGGTGVAKRDITPDVTIKFIEKRLYGFEQAMMNSAMQKTPHATISRAVAGTSSETLIINLPGSPKAVKENLEAVLPAIKHTIEKLQGDESDCAPKS